VLFNRFWQLQLTLRQPRLCISHDVELCGVYSKLASRIARILPVGDRILHIKCMRIFWPVPSWRHQDCLERSTLSHKKWGLSRLSQPKTPNRIIALLDSKHRIFRVICAISLYSFSRKKVDVHLARHTGFIFFGSSQKSHLHSPNGNWSLLLRGYLN